MIDLTPQPDALRWEACEAYNTVKAYGRNGARYVVGYGGPDNARPFWVSVNGVTWRTPRMRKFKTQAGAMRAVEREVEPLGLDTMELPPHTDRPRTNAARNK